jgi:hypothetical protein
MSGTDLHDRLMGYLRIREALGLAVGADAKVLHNFVEFAAAHGTTESVTSQVVFEWLDATSKERLGNAPKRLTLVRQFLLHLSAARPDTQVPEWRLIAGRKRPTPFVFTPSETELLLQGATEIAPGTFFSLVIQTALGLIAATEGLRSRRARLRRRHAATRSRRCARARVQVSQIANRAAPHVNGSAPGWLRGGASTPEQRLAHNGVLYEQAWPTTVLRATPAMLPRDRPAGWDRGA